MGEIIKVLSEGVVSGINIEIELNSPTNVRTKEQVHIQAESQRLEIDVGDFEKYASILLLAEKNLKAQKGIL